MDWKLKTSTGAPVTATDITLSSHSNYDRAWKIASAVYAAGVNATLITNASTKPVELSIPANADICSSQNLLDGRTFTACATPTKSYGWNQFKVSFSIFDKTLDLNTYILTLRNIDPATGACTGVAAENKSTETSSSTDVWEVLYVKPQNVTQMPDQFCVEVDGMVGANREHVAVFIQ